MKAIIVDDSKTDAYVCAKAAQKLFSEVVVVGTPHDLNVTLLTFRPDIIFMDVHIGDVHNGIGLIQEFRERTNDTSIVPMVVTTSSTGDAIKRLARDSGATAFINKPVTLDLMTQVVQKHVPGFSMPDSPGVIRTRMF